MSSKRKPPPSSETPGGPPSDGLVFGPVQPARGWSSLTEAERAHLADFAELIEEQSEFGDVEALDVLSATGAIVFHLYWWPMTDGVLVDAASGDVVCDLVDGVLMLRERHEDHAPRPRDRSRARRECGGRARGAGWQVDPTPPLLPFPATA